MKNPLVSISWGELFDKITILQIKYKTLNSQEASRNVEKELKLLETIYERNFMDEPQANKLKKELAQTNKKLWEIEDRIREKEKNKTFDSEFIQLARSVYLTNDERSAIKRRINDVFESELVEEKSYSKY